jgi:hypothetical protein
MSSALLLTLIVRQKHPCQLNQCMWLNQLVITTIVSQYQRRLVSCLGDDQRVAMIVNAEGMAHKHRCHNMFVPHVFE